MTRVRFDVLVADEESAVIARFHEAADDPSQFVKMFTTSDDVRADVEPDGSTFYLNIEGPGFEADGIGRVLARPPGSSIGIDMDVKGRGLLRFAGPAISLAAGKIEGEATEALQREFGTPA